MKCPLESSGFTVLPQVESTQDEVAEAVLSGSGPLAVLALDQTAGRGRFSREWVSAPGDSLTLSVAFPDYADHPRPWLIGMGCAAAAAAAIHCRIQWPNDLVLDGKKVGGILTENVTDGHAKRVAVVGIGINLNQREFPEELSEIATSLAIHRPGVVYEVERIARMIGERIALLPEPDSWDAICPVWNLFDATSGKKFRLISGEEAVGIGIGGQGELICAVEGETTTVMAADAIFGQS